MDHRCGPGALVWPHWPDTAYTMEAKAGGRWSARSEQGETGVEGEVLRLAEPHALELTWRWDGEKVEDLVRIRLAETSDGTSVTVRHRTPTRALENYRLGWQYVLGNLSTAVQADIPTEASHDEPNNMSPNLSSESTPGN
jgi:uncharacterized protein YndB with AHSA1/START domain